MKIQLALDRMTIPEAVGMAEKVAQSVDWIEVGTSLIKEFGVDSVKEMKRAFPDKVIVADIKTIDNARYEFEMCFEAGADVATVMGVSPLVTIDASMEVAGRYGRMVMIDLLNTSEEQQRELLKYKDAIFCEHVSKDQQEEMGAKNQGRGSSIFSGERMVAVAGGITLSSLVQLQRTLKPEVVIVGSAITKAENPSESAAQFKELILHGEGK
ncbi:3-hexulose-6-phosphate synthase [Mesobacillus foraminis]|uniref:3-hexulose-6-phosphate synthase n=1 Tax=Mesobacillus foraminis TaxID=279826 RepID=A0A4R2BBV4_9BACI|nr:3-hexulose-6-phosphate synthase [Mesobacillus foraminis]TCN24196.1 3-hexulose-6-phosphate synthase [Mesobacillus foraminis]